MNGCRFAAGLSARNAEPLWHSTPCRQPLILFLLLILSEQASYRRGGGLTGT